VIKESRLVGIAPNKSLHVLDMATNFSIAIGMRR
jgi:hypothetical protein